jgi:hypothetical protein
MELFPLNIMDAISTMILKISTLVESNEMKMNLRREATLKIIFRALRSLKYYKNPIVER